MAVAVHNPSTLDLTTAKVAVPHGNYYVKYFDKASEEFKKADASVLCNKDYVHGNATAQGQASRGKRVLSCFAHVKVPVPAKGAALLVLTHEPKEELKGSLETIKVGDRINTDELILIFAGYDVKSSKLDFQLKNTRTGDVENFDFSLKYWASKVAYAGFGGGTTNSGTYVFNPEVGQKESYDYSHFKNGSIALGPHGQQMNFFFANPTAFNDKEWY